MLIAFPFSRRPRSREAFRCELHRRAPSTHSVRAWSGLWPNNLSSYLRELGTSCRLCLVLPPIIAVHDGCRVLKHVRRACHLSVLGRNGRLRHTGSWGRHEFRSLGTHSSGSRQLGILDGPVPRSSSRTYDRRICSDEEGLAMDTVADPLLGSACLRHYLATEGDVQAHNPRTSREEAQHSRTPITGASGSEQAEVHTGCDHRAAPENALHRIDRRILLHLHGVQLQRPLRLLRRISHRLPLSVPRNPNIPLQHR